MCCWTESCDLRSASVAVVEPAKVWGGDKYAGSVFDRSSLGRAAFETRACDLPVLIPLSTARDHQTKSSHLHAPETTPKGVGAAFGP